jgi:hypothetical protein
MRQCGRGKGGGGHIRKKGCMRRGRAGWWRRRVGWAVDGQNNRNLRRASKMTDKRPAPFACRNLDAGQHRNRDCRIVLVLFGSGDGFGRLHSREAATMLLEATSEMPISFDCHGFCAASQVANDSGLAWQWLFETAESPVVHPPTQELERKKRRVP